MKTELYPWFEEQWNQISSIPKNKFPQALIVTGLADIGKKNFCLLLIQSLFCENRVNRADKHDLPCAVCPSCRQILASTHGDFLTLKKIEGKKSIGVEQIREMIKWVHLSHPAQQKKVLFIPQADQMTLAASNALLKTLEEPPADVIIVLLVNHLKSLIATIRSRCQIIALEKPDKSMISRWLDAFSSTWDINANNQTYLTENKQLIFCLASNSPLKIKKLLCSKALTQRKQILDSLFSIINDQLASVLATIELTKSSIAVEEIFYWLATVIFDLIYLQFKVDSHKLINQDYLQQLSAISAKLNSLLLFELQTELLQYYKFQDVALNQQLLLDNYLIKWRNCKNVL